MSKRVHLAGLALVVVCLGSVAAADAPKVLIATWRGCEEACEGAKSHLSSLLGEVDITVRDAGRDATVIPNILEQARAAETDLIISWGTSVTLGIAGTLADVNDGAYNHDIPQVFMIVADPVGSGIVESLEKTGRDNLTGTYNRVPDSVYIDTLRRILPDLATVGLLYNPSEMNSVLKRDELNALLPGMGVTLADRAFDLDGDGSPRTEDIGREIRRLKEGGADALYVGSSSFIRANASIFGAAARDSGLVVISPYEEMVKNGNALISVAARYRDVGHLAAEQAAQILRTGVSAGELPVARITDFALTINLDYARDIGVFPPIELLQLAEVVD